MSFNISKPDEKITAGQELHVRLQPGLASERTENSLSQIRLGTPAPQPVAEMDIGENLTVSIERQRTSHNQVHFAEGVANGSPLYPTLNDQRQPTPAARVYYENLSQNHVHFTPGLEGISPTPESLSQLRVGTPCPKAPSNLIASEPEEQELLAAKINTSANTHVAFVEGTASPHTTEEERIAYARVATHSPAYVHDHPESVVIFPAQNADEPTGILNNDHHHIHDPNMHVGFASGTMSPHTSNEEKVAFAEVATHSPSYCRDHPHSVDLPQHLRPGPIPAVPHVHFEPYVAGHSPTSESLSQLRVGTPKAKRSASFDGDEEDDEEDAVVSSPLMATHQHQTNEVHVAFAPGTLSPVTTEEERAVFAQVATHSPAYIHDHPECATAGLHSPAASQHHVHYPPYQPAHAPSDNSLSQVRVGTPKAMSNDEDECDNDSPVVVGHVPFGGGGTPIGSSGKSHVNAHASSSVVTSHFPIHSLVNPETSILGHPHHHHHDPSAHVAFVVGTLSPHTTEEEREAFATVTTHAAGHIAASDSCQSTLPLPLPPVPQPQPEPQDMPHHHHVHDLNAHVSFAAGTVSPRTTEEEKIAFAEVATHAVAHSAHSETVHHAHIDSGLQHHTHHPNVHVSFATGTASPHTSEAEREAFAEVAAHASVHMNLQD